MHVEQVHFGNEEKLRGIVVLDPQWLTKVMATVRLPLLERSLSLSPPVCVCLTLFYFQQQVFTTKQSFAKNGILPHSILPQIWRPPAYPPELHPFLIKLLHQFDIAITLNIKVVALSRNCALRVVTETGRTERGVLNWMQGTEEDYSLLPSLLPEEPPQDLRVLWPLKKPGEISDMIEFGRNYSFDFIPKGFFAKIMVRILSLKLQAACYWRYHPPLPLHRANRPFICLTPPFSPSILLGMVWSPLLMVIG